MIEGVKEGVIDIEAPNVGVTLDVGVNEGVNDAVGVKLGVIDGVNEGVGVREGVGDNEIIGSGRVV